MSKNGKMTSFLLRNMVTVAVGTPKFALSHCTKSISLFIFWGSLVVRLGGLVSTMIAVAKKRALLALSWNCNSSDSISCCESHLGNLTFVIYAQ